MYFLFAFSLSTASLVALVLSFGTSAVLFAVVKANEQQTASWANEERLPEDRRRAADAAKISASEACAI